MLTDILIKQVDTALRTLLAPAVSRRAHPDRDIADTPMNPKEKQHALGLMRVNHVGEVCAQALYAGQALTARDTTHRQAFAQAAQEEVEHLAWTAQRVKELGGHTSVLNPLWYAGSFVIGVGAGLLGDRWNLGFLEETEQQVTAHLDDHLGRLPVQDAKSRAIVAQMREDEQKHAQMAKHYGAAALPAPVRGAMKLSSRLMTGLSYHL